MPTIRENGPYTVIIEFEVNPENQKELIAEIQKSGNPSQHTGFVSASLHASRDGSRVLNYAQWESEKAYENFRASSRDTENSKPLVQAIQRLGVRMKDVRAYDVIQVVEVTGSR